MGLLKRGGGGTRRVGGRGTDDLAVFGTIFVAIVLLWSTPVVYPLKVLVVLLHEISHGIAAVLTGGSIVKIEVSAAQGGSCVTSGGWRFATLSAGYLGSMLFGAGILVAAAKSRVDKKLATGFGVFLLVVTLLYVRNTFGLVTGIGVGGALVFMGLKLPNRVSDVALKVIGATSCLYAILDIVDDVLRRRHLRSDAVMLAELTHIPSVVWGVLWVGLSVVVTVMAFRFAAGGGRRAR